MAIEEVTAAKLQELVGVPKCVLNPQARRRKEELQNGWTMKSLR